MLRSVVSSGILLANVEGFATKSCQRLWSFSQKTARSLLAVDESTTIKVLRRLTKSLRVRVGAKASYRRILTGSPVTKSLMDLYAQCRVF